MEEEIELADLFSVLWQKKKIIIVTAILFAVIACIGNTIIEVINKNKIENEDTDIAKVYYAQTTFLIATSQTTTTTIEQTTVDNMPVNIKEVSKNYIDNVSLKTYNEILKSPSILNNIKTKLNITDDLYNSILVSQVMDSNLLAITVKYSNEQQAVQIADELMNEFIQSMSKTYFVDQVSVIDKAYIVTDEDIARIFKNYITEATQAKTDLTNKILTDVEFSKLISIEEFREIFETYILNDEDIKALNVNDSLETILKIPSSSVPKYSVLAGAFGLILSCGIILVNEIFNKTIQSENSLKDNVLANVQYNGNKDIFDILRIKLEKNKVMLITSSENDDRNSYVTNNLAISFANMQKKTLLLDLTSNSNELLEKANENGLYNLIQDKTQKTDNCISKSNTNNLDIMLAGTQNISCIPENNLKDILTNLEKTYDYIIINSNNILDNANTLQISKTIQNTILLAFQGKTTLKKYNKTKNLISDIKGTILGTILVR